MEIIKRGAEAILYLDEFEGQKVLVKERIRKGYRIPQLDERIRKVRTKREARLLTDARELGVNTPRVLQVTENKIVMEFVDGERMKELLQRKANNKLCMAIGKAVGKMHAHNLIHGDLTTSNMILCKGKIYFIDFGLGSISKRAEDRGVDLRLLYEAMKSTHFKILKSCWENIVKGYRQEYKDAEQVLRKVDEIEKRARYAKGREQT